MSQAAIPPTEAARAKFDQEAKHPKAPAYGMGDIPDNMMNSLVLRMPVGDEMREQDIAVTLTYAYGGEFLRNALRIYHPVGDKLPPSDPGVP